MENSKEHLRTILDEAIPTPHFNVVNFRALREFLEYTIELQTSYNITDSNCDDLTNSLNTVEQELDTQLQINEPEVQYNIADEMSTSINLENQAILLCDENVLSKTETSTELHMSKNQTDQPSMNSKDQQLIGEHINKCTKKLKSAYEKIPRKYCRKIVPIVNSLAKKNKLPQTSKKKEFKQDTEVEFESKNLKQEISKREIKTNIIDKPILTDAKSAKKILIEIPSIRIPKKRTKLRSSKRGERTDHSREENDECSISNSSESNETRCDIDALRQNIEVKIKGSKHSHTDNQMREIDASAIKSILGGVKVTIKIPSIRMKDKKVKFRNIKTKSKTVSKKNGDEEIETLKKDIERSNKNDIKKIQNVKNEQKSDVECSVKDQTEPSIIKSCKKPTKANTKTSKPRPDLNGIKRRIGAENKTKRMSKDKKPPNSCTGAKIVSVEDKPKAKKKVSLAPKASKPKEYKIPNKTDRYEDCATESSKPTTKSIEKRPKKFRRNDRSKTMPKSIDKIEKFCSISDPTVSLSKRVGYKTVTKHSNPKDDRHPIEPGQFDSNQAGSSKLSTKTIVKRLKKFRKMNRLKIKPEKIDFVLLSTFIHSRNRWLYLPFQVQLL